MSSSVFKFVIAIFATTSFLAFSTVDTGTDPKSKSLIDALHNVNGGWLKLASKKDVQFTYIYNDFVKGTDLSTEKYIFEGQCSWAEYRQHDVNVMPGMEGIAKQCLMNGEAKISLDGKNITDPKAIRGTSFLRTANFFWFTMMYKINDQGTHHEYLGQQEINGINYDKVKLSYNPEEVGKEVNDSYILFFNPNTHLVDQFLFSLQNLGKKRPVLKMELEYQNVDGMYVATTRRAYGPDKKGKYKQMGEYFCKDIKFNNGFKAEDFKL